MKNLRIRMYVLTLKEVSFLICFWTIIGMILGVLLAMLTSCSNQPFTGFHPSEVADSGSALFGDKDRFVVAAVSPRDSGLNDEADSPLVTLPEAATDSGIEETTPIPDAASKPILESADASIPDSGPPLPVQCVSSLCPTGTYGERGCCRLNGTCGVIFTGQSHDCIAFR